MGHFKKEVFIITALSLLYSFSVYAFEKDYELRFNDHFIQGSEIIKLKKALRRQYNELNFKNVEMREVKIIAKSRRGNGEVQLVVDNQRSNRKRIPGKLRDFSSPERNTFFKIFLKNPNYYSSKGAWNLFFRGNVKLRKVVVTIDHLGGNPDPIYYREKGSFNASKFHTTTRVFRIFDRKKVKSIRLRASRNNVNIQYVRVKFANGKEREMIDLYGHLKKDHKVYAWFDGSFRGRRIVEVSITAITPNMLSENRSRVHLDLGILRY